MFEEVKARGEIVKNPIKEVIRDDWRNILRGIGLRVAETAGYAVSVTFMLSYLKSQNLADNTLTLTALCIASGIGIFATYNWGKPPTASAAGRSTCSAPSSWWSSRSRCSCWSTPESRC